MFERRLFFHIDWALLAAILALVGLGIAMIYSTTYVTLPDGTGHPGREVRTQIHRARASGSSRCSSSC